MTACSKENIALLDPVLIKLLFIIDEYFLNYRTSTLTPDATYLGL